MWAVKPLLLPSAGTLGYSSILEIKEPDVLLGLQAQLGLYGGSETDYIYFLISKYTSAKNPEEIYFKDAFFVWLYVYHLMSKKSDISFEHRCRACNKINKITIDISQGKTIFLTPNKCKPQPIKIQLQDEELIIDYRYRKIKDNLYTGIIDLESGGDSDILTSFLNYFSPQVENITLRNKHDNFSKIDIEDLKDVLNALGLSKILHLFNEIRTESWGAADRYEYTCACKTKNIAFLGDSYSSSIYTIQEEDDKQEFNSLKSIVALAAMKVLTFEELLTTPQSQYKDISDAIIEVKSNTNVGNYLDEFGGGT